MLAAFVTSRACVVCVWAVCLFVGRAYGGSEQCCCHTHTHTHTHVAHITPPPETGGDCGCGV